MATVHDVTCAYAQRCAYKDPTEDRIVICSVIENIITIYALFDGHGGVVAVDFISCQLLEILKKYLIELYESIDTDSDLDSELFKTKCIHIITKSFHEVDELYISKYKSIPNNSGTTATVLIEIPKHLIVGNVGDSPFIYFNRESDSDPGFTNILGQTIDHSPKNEHEKQRLSLLLSEYESNNNATHCLYCNMSQYPIQCKRCHSLRIDNDYVAICENKGNIRLSTTRSLGDIKFKKFAPECVGVISTPTTYIFPKIKDSYVILCSDSFTEQNVILEGTSNIVIRNTGTYENIVSTVNYGLLRSNDNLSEAVELLVHEQIHKFYDKDKDKFYGDNTSMILMKI